MQSQKFYIQLAKAFKDNGRADDLIKVYQELIQTDPKQPFWFYKLLGDALNQKGQLKDAIIAYQEAIKLQANRPDLYRLLAISQAKQGDIDGSIASYQKVIELNPDESQVFRESVAKALKQHQAIYLHIWDTLNQVNIETCNRSKFCYPTDLNGKGLTHYFAINSQYKLIDLSSLSLEDKLFFEKYRISLTHLKSIKNDDSKAQDRYFEHFYYHLKKQQNLEIQPQKNKLQHGLDFSPEAMVFHQYMMKTGSIYTICPSSGRFLISNQSFLFIVGMDVCIYRFSGNEIFYLIVGTASFVKKAIYIPRLELIIKLSDNYSINFSDTINKLKSFTVSCWKKLLKYLADNSSREKVAVLGFHHNFGHYLKNELSGITKAYRNKFINLIDKFIFGYNHPFGDLSDLFPEIPLEKIIRVSKSDINDIPKMILDNNYFVLATRGSFIDEEITKKIYLVSRQKCTASLLAEIEKAKQHFPLVWINVRTGSRRVWRSQSQIEGLANLIQQIGLDFPQAAIIFDGCSRIDRGENSSATSEDEYIEKERALAQQIIARLPETHIPIYNVIGCMMHESIIWANAIDLYVVPAGTGLTKVVWIANKPGISYGPHAYMKNFKQSISEQRENGIPISWISEHSVFEIQESDTIKINLCYECDWRGIYEEVLKIIPTLTRNSRQP